MANKENHGALGDGGQAEGAKREEPSPTDALKEEFQKLKADLQGAELSRVAAASLSDEQLKVMQERLYRMVDYTVKRQDWYADQCHRMLQIGLALIAAGGAIAALFAKLENLPSVTQILAWAFALCLFATGMIMLHLYNSYLAGDHPYRNVVDIYSWYFAYTFPQDLDPNLSKAPEIAKQQVRQEASYIRAYFDRFLDHAKERSSLIREDIEQVAILLILQRYRAQQTRKMSQWLFKGLLVTAVVFVFLIASFFVFLIRPQQHPMSGTSSVSSAAPAKSAPASQTHPSTTPTTPSPTRPESTKHAAAKSTPDARRGGTGQKPP